MTAGKGRSFAIRATLAVALILTLTPLLSMISAALQPADRNPAGLMWPSDPQWGNFGDAFRNGHLGELFLSSSLIVLGVVPATLVFGTLAGFALGNLRIRGGRFMLVFLLFGLTIPFEALIIPLYFEMQDFGLLNSRWSVILPLIGLYMPFSVIWMRVHFGSIPRELSEAARLDGATMFQELARVQLPLAGSSLSALGILLFIWTWNQFLLPVVLIADPLHRTVAGALTYFQGQYSSSIPLLNASALMVIAPAIVIFIIFQRFLVGAQREMTN